MNTKIKLAVNIVSHSNGYQHKLVVRNAENGDYLLIVSGFMKFVSSLLDMIKAGNCAGLDSEFPTLGRVPETKNAICSVFDIDYILDSVEYTQE